MFQRDELGLEPKKERGSRTSEERDIDFGVSVGKVKYLQIHRSDHRSLACVLVCSWMLYNVVYYLYIYIYNYIYVYSWRHGDNGALRLVRFWPSTLDITCDAAVMFMLHGGWGWGGVGVG